MPVPQPRSFSLKEAASYVADRCDVSIEEAKAALDRAFREYSLGVFSDRFEKVQGWQGAAIDWDNSAVVGGEHLTINGIHYTVRVSVFRQHLDKWTAQAAPASWRSRTISLDNASVRIGEAKFGADWIGKLTERERWLIKRYVERRHQTPSSILPGEITLVGPGGPKIPVNDPKLASEVERARDRLEQMNDQYDEVYDWLEDRGFDTETPSLDLTQFERAFAATFSAAAKPMRARTRLITGTERHPKPADNKPVSRPPSREKVFWPAARGAAVKWLIENGCPAPNDGNQAALERHVSEWLENHGHEASEAAVRRHAARWIKEYRDKLNA
jgi:hypothetical protein